MKILGIIFAFFAVIIGLRMVIIAIMTVLSGKVLVRKGFRSRWQPVATRDEVWPIAFRDALMGFLFIILGVALII